MEMDNGLSADTSGALGVLEKPDEANVNPWVTILYNDPKNIMDYVTFALVETLKCSEEQAKIYMETAHVEGKAAVFSGTQEKASEIAKTLGTYMLWASVEKG